MVGRRLVVKPRPPLIPSYPNRVRKMGFIKIFPFPIEKYSKSVIIVMLYAMIITCSSQGSVRSYQYKKRRIINSSWEM